MCKNRQISKKPFCQQWPAVRNYAWRKSGMKAGMRPCVQARSCLYACSRRWRGALVAGWLSAGDKWSPRRETDVRVASSSSSSEDDCINISVMKSILKVGNLGRIFFPWNMESSPSDTLRRILGGLFCLYRLMSAAWRFSAVPWPPM